jgi:hypothetical protein
MPDGTCYGVGRQALDDLFYLCTMRTRMWQQQPDAQKKRDVKQLLVSRHVVGLQLSLTNNAWD